MQRTRAQRDVPEQHREAEERHDVRRARHLLDVAGQRAEHEAGADEAADARDRRPTRRCRASCGPRAWRTRAHQDHRGEAVHELLAGHRDDDALDVAPRRPPTAGTRCTTRARSDRRASGTRATRAGSGARSRGCGHRSSATSTSPSGSAGDIEIRPRYHSGSPHHDVTTSVTTAAAQTHSTAGEIDHDAQPTQRHAQPVAVACSSVRMSAYLLDRSTVTPSRVSRTAGARATPHGPRLGKGSRGGRQPRCVPNHSRARASRRPPIRRDSWRGRRSGTRARRRGSGRCRPRPARRPGPSAGPPRSRSRCPGRGRRRARARASAATTTPRSAVGTAGRRVRRCHPRRTRPRRRASGGRRRGTSPGRRSRTRRCRSAPGRSPASSRCAMVASTSARMPSSLTPSKSGMTFAKSS